MWVLVVIVALVTALLVVGSLRYARHNAASSGTPDDPDRIWKRNSSGGGSTAI